MMATAPDATRDRVETLASQIRESAQTDEPVNTELATSQRIIARVTDGIYREPWAAFRELVANAFDADAKSVIIETGAPEFEQVVVRDDGNGMSPETLAYMLQNIGGSSKRTSKGAKLMTVKSGDSDLSPGGRPLIGKIGIGLFAVAQLTQHFQIITKAQGENLRTSATVLLRTHDEDKMRDKNGDEEYVAGSVTIKSETVPDDELDTHGTAVVLYSLRPEVRRSLQSVSRWSVSLAEGIDGEPIRQSPIYHMGLVPGAIAKDHKGLPPVLPWEPSDDPSEKFEKLVDVAGDVSGRGTKPATLEHFDEYLRLLWQLSLSIPLHYIHGHPFDIDGSSGMTFFNVPKGRGQAQVIKIPKKKTLRKHLQLISGSVDPCGGFTVTVDDITLSRPVTLPTELRKKSRVRTPVMMVSKEVAPFGTKNLDRAGGPLSFEAYLYWNSKIVPKDTAGVLVRVREASGTLFDQSFLKYQVSEQTRLRQITAEIFVQAGLDSAINIDRESFNYSHPHFLYIQRWLHKALRLLVNRLKALADEDLRKEKAERSEEQRHRVTNAAYNVWKRRLGEDADPPLPDHSMDSEVSEVGGVEIDWSEDGLKGDTEKAAALAVVLEAYGVLSNLSAGERSRLINDIIFIFEPDA